MKRIPILMFALLVALMSYGQRKPKPKDFTAPLRSNLDIGFRGGVGELMANADMSSPTKLGPNVGLDVNYTYLYDNHWGIHLGTNIVYSSNSYKTETVESQFVGTIELYDGGSTVTRTSHYTLTTPNVRETYTSVMAEVPIQLSFRWDYLFFDIGLKAIVPLGIKADYQYGTTEIGVGREIDGTGSHIDVPIPCGTIDPQKGEYSLSETAPLSFPILTSLSFDVGYRVPLRLHNLLYIGFSLDYALFHPSIPGENELVAFENGELHFNNIAQTHYMTSLGYMTMGLKIQYSFCFGKRANYEKNPWLPKKHHKRGFPRHAPFHGRKIRMPGAWY